MKLRVCVPVFVPGTTAHDVHEEPLNFVNRIEFALSLLLIANNQTFAPSVAPNNPPPDLND